MDLRHDRLTWVAYLVLAWFAYLQAAPGLISARLERALGRRALFWSAAGLTDAGAVGPPGRPGRPRTRRLGACARRSSLKP